VMEKREESVIQGDDQRTKSNRLPTLAHGHRGRLSRQADFGRIDARTHRGGGCDVHLIDSRMPDLLFDGVDVKY
jgi:hypothetical protein